MRPLVLLGLVAMAFAACAPDPPPPPPADAPDPVATPDTTAPPDAAFAITLDVAAWLRDVRTAQRTGDPAAEAALAETLHEATRWADACSDAGAPGERAPGWGASEIVALGDGGYLARMLCAYYAYQGAHAFVRLTRPPAADTAGAWRAEVLDFPVAEPREGGGRARLVRSQEIVGETALAADASMGDGRAALDVFTKARGPGDCGVYSRYAIVATGPPVLRQARARGCDDPADRNADGIDAPDPASWPVVYP